MATGTAAEILSRIEDLLIAAETRDITFQEGITTLLENIKTDTEAISTATSNINAVVDAHLPDMHNDLLSIADWLSLNDTKNDTIISLLEFINSNGALNAQNGQILTIGQGNGCCDVLPVIEGQPERKCARTQRVYDWVALVADTLCLMSNSGSIPSVEELRDILRNDAWSPSGKPMYTDAELASIQGAIATRGWEGLSALCSMDNHTAMKAHFIEVITNAPDALTAGNDIAADFFFDLGISPPWDKFIRYLFPQSVINLIYDDSIDITDGAYDNEICGESAPTPACEDGEQNQGLLGGYGGGSNDPETRGLNTMSPAPMTGYWYRIIVAPDDLGGLEGGELWRTDTLPDELVATLVVNEPYDFQAPLTVGSGNFEIRFNNFVPEGWDTEIFVYNNIYVCNYWADGAPPIIPD